MHPRDKSPTYYEYYPRLFHAYFFDVSSEHVELLSKAGYIYYQSTLFADAIIDKKEV